MIGRTSTSTNDDGSQTIQLRGRELQIGGQFISDLKRNRIADVIPTLNTPLMIFHSPVDSVVSVDNARRLYETAKHPKRFVSIDGADHMLSNPEDAKFVAETLAAWATRYLQDDKPIDADTTPVVEEGTVTSSGAIRPDTAHSYQST